LDSNNNITIGACGAVATGTISGTKFVDSNGDGVRQAGEAGLAGITVFLETTCNDHLDTGEQSTTTNADGNYLFTDITAGTYTVREVVPAGWMQTTANPGAVVVTAGADTKGGDFGDLQLAKSYVKNISYSVSHKGVTRTYANLNGHVSAGDTVKMNFKVMAGHSAWASLASYRAPSAGAQAVVDGRQSLFGAGKHSLSLKVQKPSFQIYSAGGKIIPSLQSSGKNGYAAQNRLFSVTQIA